MVVTVDARRGIVYKGKVAIGYKAEKEAKAEVAVALPTHLEETLKEIYPQKYT